MSVTDATGAVTTTVYDTLHDLPSVVTDALGNTSCYKYDHRGRKVAEWGTAMQPACFGYDDMDNMTQLITFRDEPATNEDGSPCQSAEGAAAGSTTQPIQWSSEFYDSELALVYYNYRHYNPMDGRWGSRDFIHANNLYNFCNNDSILSSDYIGLWQNVNGGTLYKAGSKDTLFGLAKKITGSGKDWPCLWPYEKAATPNSMEHRYPNICPGDIYDASNLVNPNVRSVSLVAHYEFVDTARSYAPNVEMVDASVLARVIRNKAKDGATPITHLTVFSHGNPTGILGGVLHSKAVTSYAYIDDINKLNYQPTYSRAVKKKGPVRCWFTKNAIAHFVGCHTASFAEPFAKIALRKSAKAIGANQSIGLGIVKGKLHFVYEIKYNSNTRKIESATEDNDTSWEKILDNNKVWESFNGMLN